jgi:hypothetical protein
MKYLILIILVISFSCKDKGNREGENEQTNNKPAPQTAENPTVKTHSFSSKEWGVAFEYPENFEVHEGELAPNSPVINIYPSAGVTPPLGIHEQAEITYIAIIPHGYGVDGPAGSRVSVTGWEGGLPITFSIDEENSTVYLLENNEPWGYLLKFHQTPENWKSQGSIFIRLGVQNFKAVCEEKEDGEEISMSDCDPLAGHVMKFYGKIKQEERKAVEGILRSLYFFSNGKEVESLEDLIMVEEPTRNSEVSSPMNIKGMAKGYWFFEADAPVELVDKNHNLLGRGWITAKEEWMTEDFVPFEGSLEFEKPVVKNGYLILKKSNASGKPEHDRAYHIPVNFK